MSTPNSIDRAEQALRYIHEYGTNNLRSACDRFDLFLPLTTLPFLQSPL